MNDGTQPHPPPKKPGSGCQTVLLVGFALLVGMAILVSVTRGGGDPIAQTSLPEITPKVTDYSSPEIKTTEDVREFLDSLEDSPEPEEEPEPEPEPDVPGIGDKVRDGEFEFKVTKMEKRSTVGRGWGAKKAQGQWVLIHVTVKNVGGESETFHDTNQVLYDSKYREFEAESGTAVMSLGNSNAFLNKINPGNQVKAILLFDVPKKVKLVAIDLHDSAFSTGARVDLRR